MVVFVYSEISVIKLCPGPYLVPVGSFPSPYWSIHFSNVSEANGQEMLWPCRIMRPRD